MQTGTKEKSTPAPKVENNGRKKRKIELNFCFTTEIIFEIIQYFEDPNDYLNLAQLNKYYYETMLINDSYLFNKFTDILIQFMRIKLSNNLPNYMFKIQKLNITSSNSDFNLLQKFTNLKYFQVECLTNLLPYDMLEFKGNCFKYLMSLETLSLNKILFDEQNIKYLTNVVNLTIKYIEEIKINEKFLNLKNLYKLCITDCLTVNIKENLQSLRIVKIFESEVFGNFNCFPNLKELILYHTNVKDKQIMNLDKLQSLEIYPSITGECLASLTQLKKLDVQDIKEYKYLSYLKNLTDLSIRCTSIKDQDLNTLTNLKYLDISCCANIKSGKFLLNMNDLIELTCFDLVKYTGTGLDNLKNKIKNDGVTLYEYYKENNGRHLDN
ncbi:hypothetical protein ABK040_011133 [Willaertia magna]